MKNDPTLLRHHVRLDFDRTFNKNKNPTIEKGIRQLGSEILRFLPEGGAISEEQLAVIVNQLNARIRNRGLSSWEILCQRDQFSGEQIEINDLQLSEQQAQLRAANQKASAKHKARGNPSAREADVIIGSLVYIKSDGDKNQGRDRYLVVEVGDEFCTVQKFVKSQLRRKKYQLKLTEVYPVQPENIEFFGTIRGLEEDDCTERDVSENHEEHSIPTLSADREEREVPANVQAESDSADLSIVEEDVETVPNDIQSEHVEPITEAEVEPRRRSKRKTSRPAWMDSGDYVLNG